MAIHADRLSVWEIAHRWHRIDPDTSASAAQIPLHVKDTLRMLVGEVYLERLLSTLWKEKEGGLTPYWWIIRTIIKEYST
jgi:hypothetical protein